MSLATYIGCNVEIPINDELDDLVTIGSCFSDKEHRINVQKYQFTTPYVYEVSNDWGINISEFTNKKVRNESKQKLVRLCGIMDEYLEKGDYFELYSCWIGKKIKNVKVS